MKEGHIILFFSYLLVLHPVNGQDVKPFFHHLTVENGLTQTTNEYVYKDSYGFVWISSINGLNRYDGKSIKTYLPEPNDTTSLYGQNIQSPFFELANGDIAFTTYNAINVYIRAEDRFKHFKIKDPKEKDTPGYYAFHLDPEQNLWVVLRNTEIYKANLLSFETSRVGSFHQLVHRVSPHVDNNGKLIEMWGYFFQSQGVEILTIKKDSIKRISKFTKDTQTPLFIRNVTFDKKDDSAWIASENGLYSYNRVAEKLTPYHPSNIQNKTIKEAKAYGNDTLIISYEKLGLFLFSKISKQFFASIEPEISNPNSISSRNISRLTIDRDNGIWLSQFRIGVDFFHLDKTKFNNINIAPEIYSHKGVANFYTREIIEDDSSNLWYATNIHGIYIIDKEKKKSENYSSYIDRTSYTLPNYITHLYKDNNSIIWVSSWEGACYITPDRNLHQLDTRGSNPLFIYQLANNKILFCPFEGGLSEIIEINGKYKLEQIQSVSRGYPFLTLWEDSKKRLFGCQDASSIIVFDYVDDYKLLKELPIAGETNAFFENPEDGSIWIANSNGLIRINSELDIDSIKVFTEKDGLPDRVIQGMLPDNKGRLWLSTNRGLASFDLKTHSVKQFTLADGLPSLTFNTNSSFRGENGELLFGSSKGIVHFHPDQIKEFDVKANPTITNILINDDEDKGLKCELTGATNTTEIKELNLPFDRNTISFNFAALEYSDPSSTKFRYQMVGVDDDYVESGIRDFTRYANLPYGRYSFNLMATNSDGVWSGPRTLDIEIEPPFYRTCWFYLFVGVMMAGGIWAIIIARRKRAEERFQSEVDKRVALEQERQRIARDVHDDLGSGLSALSLQTAMAQYKSSPEELKKEIDRINSSARDLSGKIREVIWTVSANNDTLPNLISYLNRYAQELFENTDIDFSVNLPDDIPDKTIAGEHRRTTFLAFKEALNNVLKHADATEVAINFKTTSDTFIIYVDDNGKGFDPALLNQSTGNGLLNMRTRMKEIGADCQFETSKKGTTVTFTLKFSEK